MTFLSKQCQPVFIYRFFMVNHKEIFQYGWIDMAYTICNFSHPIIDYSLLFNPLCFENQIKLIRFLSFLDALYYLTIKEICLKEMSIYTIPGDFLSLTLTIDFHFLLYLYSFPLCYSFHVYMYIKLESIFKCCVHIFAVNIGF